MYTKQLLNVTFQCVDFCWVKIFYLKKLQNQCTVEVLKIKTTQAIVQKTLPKTTFCLIKGLALKSESQKTMKIEHNRGRLSCNEHKLF